MKNIRYDFSNINMCGRVCYLIMCIEKYLVTLWPERDWTVVSEHLWSWVSLEDWSVARELSDMVVPAFILEKPDYEQTNAEYDGNYRKIYMTNFLICSQESLQVTRTMKSIP